MRRGVYSRGKWDPVFASKKRYLEFEQRGRKAVDDIFLKVRHMYLGLLGPANAIRGGGTGFGTNLRRLTERPLMEPDPYWSHPFLMLLPVNRFRLFIE